jgi:hypothetical protein
MRSPHARYARPVARTGLLHPVGAKHLLPAVRNQPDVATALASGVRRGSAPLPLARPLASYRDVESVDGEVAPQLVNNYEFRKGELGNPSDFFPAVRRIRRRHADCSSALAPLTRITRALRQFESILGDVDLPFDLGDSDVAEDAANQEGRRPGAQPDRGQLRVHPRSLVEPGGRSASLTPSPRTAYCPRQPRQHDVEQGRVGPRGPRPLTCNLAGGRRGRVGLQTPLLP